MNYKLLAKAIAVVASWFIAFGIFMGACLTLAYYAGDWAMPIIMGIIGFVVLVNIKYNDYKRDEWKRKKWLNRSLQRL